jgi:dihydrofolate reductase
MTPGGKPVVLVAAVAANGVIGDRGTIPWRIPGEQARFKAVTLGHTLVMGRATYDSIGRPLPGRTTIVLTRDPSWRIDGVLVAGSLAEALRLADGLPGDVMVAGGEQVYAAALPVADVQLLTRVHQSPEGDTRYPDFDPADWEEADREELGTHDVVRLTRVARGSSGAPTG